MIIYANGCSHTAGGCFKQFYSWPNLIMKSVIDDKTYMTNPKNNDFDHNVNVLYNEAKHGAGNDFIFHKSLNTISSLIQNGNKPNYVIIQWSGPSRRMHTFPEGFVFVNPWDYTKYGVLFEPYGSEHTIHFMFSLQEFLKKNEINYVFFNYMALDKSIKRNPIYKELDFERFLNFGMGNDIIFNGIIDVLKSNNMCCDDQGHPNHDGNYFISTEITNKLGIELIDMKKFHKSLVL